MSLLANSLVAFLFVAASASAKSNGCFKFFVDDVEFECPANSVYIASEGKCINVQHFDCAKYSSRVFEYVPDPYLCNVYHMCFEGRDIERICCSKDEIFSHPDQSCIARPESEEDGCESNACASLYANDICASPSIYSAGTNALYAPRASYLQCPVSGSGVTTTAAPVTTTTATMVTTTTATTVTTTATTVTTTKPVLVCDGTNNGQYVCDPNNSQGYYYCDNGNLIHGVCPGITVFSCTYLWCS